MVVAIASFDSPPLVIPLNSNDTANGDTMTLTRDTRDRQSWWRERQPHFLFYASILLFITWALRYRRYQR